MEEEEYTGLNPWHEAVYLGQGLSCTRCHFFFQGEEQWRRDILSYDPHRWYVLIANAARASGWKMYRGGKLLCPQCVRKRKLRARRPREEK